MDETAGRFGDARKSSSSRGEESTMAGEKRLQRPTSGETRLQRGGNGRLRLTALGLREDQRHRGGRVFADLRGGRKRTAENLGGSLAVEGHAGLLQLHLRRRGGGERPPAWLWRPPSAGSAMTAARRTFDYGEGGRVEVLELLLDGELAGFGDDFRFCGRRGLLGRLGRRKAEGIRRERFCRDSC